MARCSSKAASFPTIPRRPRLCWPRLATRARRSSTRPRHPITPMRSKPRRCWSKCGRPVGIYAELQVVETGDQMKGEGAQVYNWSKLDPPADPLGAPLGCLGSGRRNPVQGRLVARIPQGLQRIWPGARGRNRSGQAQGTVCEDAGHLGRRSARTILYQPFEAYAIKKSIQWRPTTFYFMDLRPDNLRFPQA